MLIILIGIAFVLIGIGSFILTAPEQKLVLVKFFCEIALLQVFTVLMIYFTDRCVIALNAAQKHKTIKIFAPGLWLFYKMWALLHNGPHVNFEIGCK